MGPMVLKLLIVIALLLVFWNGLMYTRLSILSRTRHAFHEGVNLFHMPLNQGVKDVEKPRVKVIPHPSRYTEAEHQKTNEDDILLGKFQSILSETDAGIFKDILLKYVETCEKENFTYFMHGGTLIGSYMHHGMIPWDDDMDFWHPAKDKDKLKHAFAKLRPKYVLSTKSMSNIYKFYSADSRPTGRYEWKWPFIDIAFYVEGRHHIWMEYHPRFRRYKKSKVFTLIDRPFWNLSVKAPRDTKGVIQQYYSLKTCETASYNHSMERGGFKTYKINCKKLWANFPFAFRVKTEESKTLEVLKIGNITMNSVVVHL